MPPWSHPIAIFISSSVFIYIIPHGQKLFKTLFLYKTVLFVEKSAKHILALAFFENNLQFSAESAFQIGNKTVYAGGNIRGAFVVSRLVTPVRV